MPNRSTSRVNDPGIVRAEYEDEQRFLARRLSAWADLEGPIVEEETLALIASERPARVLDVGCGTGDFTRRVGQAVGGHIFGLDLSLQMATLTQARSVPATVGDIEALPFRDASLSCVLANRVLYHLPDLDAGLAEILRVLRPGGMVVVILYGAGHLRELWGLLGEASMATATGGDAGAAEDDVDVLRRHFPRVKERRLVGRAVFRNRAAVLGFLDAFGEFSLNALAARLGEVVTPLAATYEHLLLVGVR